MADFSPLWDADPSAAGGHPPPMLWMEPLDWLEEILPGSPILANLRRSLSRPVSNPDESTAVGIGSFTAGNNPDESTAVGIGSFTEENNPDESTAVGIGSFTEENNPDESTAVGIGSFTEENNPDESTAVGIGSFTEENNPDESTAVGIGSFTEENNPHESTAVGIGSFTEENNPHESTAVGIGSFTEENNPHESTAVGNGSFTEENNPHESTAVGIGSFTQENNPHKSTTVGIGSFTEENNPDESTAVGIGSFTQENNPHESTAVGIGSFTKENNPDESTAVGIGSFTEENNPHESTAVGIGSFTEENNPHESTAVRIGSFTEENNPHESTAVGIGSFTEENNPHESTAVGIGSFTQENNPHESTAVGIGSFTQENNPHGSTAVGIGSFTEENNPHELTAVGIGSFTEENNPDESTAVGNGDFIRGNNPGAFAITADVGENPIKEEVASFLGQEEDPSASLSPDRDLNSMESSASTSVLPIRGECSGTATSVLAWMSIPTISDSSVGAHTCPREDPMMASLNCECHGGWTSPLSFLDGSVEGIPLDHTTRWNMTKDWTTPPNLPVSRQNMTVGTTVTPICVASATTWTSPPALVGVAVNTSPVEKAATKDNVAETDSLLWRCPRDQCRALSRSELEVRLESTLIILEALSHQVRTLQDRQAWGAAPSQQRDASSQTLLSDPTQEERAYLDVHQELLRQNKALRRNRESERELSRRIAGAVGQMEEWMLNSGHMLDTVGASYLRVQEDRKSLALQQKQLGELLLKCRDKLQRSGQKQAEMKSEREKALQIKEAAELVLEAVRSHAASRIEGLTQNFDAQKCLHSLLQEANECKASLILENKKNIIEMDRRTTTLRQNWIRMQKDYQTLTNLAARCRSDREKMDAEVAAAREEVAQHREVCRKLEERTAEVAEAQGCINELTQANAVLERDLVSALQRAYVAEHEKEEACQEKQELSEQLAAEQDATRALREAAAQLSLEKEAMQRERESTNREAREATECREFIEEENQIMRRQQAETEAGLRSALATLREQGAQMEDLKGAHQTLQDKWDALRAELVASEDKARSTGAVMEAFSKSLWEMKGIHSQMLEMADLLETSRNGTPVPRRLGSSFVESVLQAAAGRESRTPGLLSESTAFAEAIPVRSAAPSEIQEDFSCCIRDFQGAAARIHRLISTRKEETQNLKAEVLQLKQSLEYKKESHQEEKEAAAANAAKLNKELHLCMQNEKELRALMREQEKRFLQLSDQSWEIAALKEEVSQLKGALQKAERELAVLWEDLDRTKKPSEGGAVREKIWLREEVEKLREMLLRKDDERKAILAQSLSQVRSLEAQLFQAKQMQRKHEQAQAEIKGALSASSPDVFQACRLLEPDA